jgi:hypothetical protein
LTAAAENEGQGHRGCYKFVDHVKASEVGKMRAPHS